MYPDRAEPNRTGPSMLPASLLVHALLLCFSQVRRVRVCTAARGALFVRTRAGVGSAYQGGAVIGCGARARPPVPWRLGASLFCGKWVSRLRRHAHARMLPTSVTFA